MNSKKFLLKICLGAGLFFSYCGIWNHAASALSLKSSTSNSSLENILTTDFEVEEEFILIPLIDSSSIGEEIQSSNLPLTEGIKVQIGTYQEQQPELLNSLIASLRQLQFNQENRNSDGYTVPILSQTGYGDTSRDVYDFETELTNNFIGSPRNPRPKLADNRQKLGLLTQEIPGYTYISYGSRTSYLDKIKGNASQIFGFNSISQYSQIPVNASYYSRSISLLQQDYSIQNLLNTTSRIESLQIQYSQDKVSNNFSLSPREIEIETTNLGSIRRPSIQKTPEQIALEERLQEQREKLEERTKKLREKLEKQRKKREEQRRKKAEKQAEQRKKRLEQMAKRQEKLRNRYR